MSELQIGDVQWLQIPNTQLLLPYRDILCADGSYTRIEYYHDFDPKNPTASELFDYRFNLLWGEINNWQTVIADSSTSIELAYRKKWEYKLAPRTYQQTKGGKNKGDSDGNYDQRHWYGGSKHDLEEVYCQRFPSLPMNVVLLTHIYEKTMDEGPFVGEIIRNPDVPGMLRNNLTKHYMECYRMYAMRDPSNPQQIHRVLQTVIGEQFVAGSQISAPNPCYPHYESLWQNYTLTPTRPPLKVLVYGKQLVGKSTFAATFPGPRLVFMFDSHGKDFPYWRGGV